MTVTGPFHTHSGNGYFGAWLALGMSWLLYFDFLPTATGRLDSFCRRGVELIGVLTLASLTVFVQTLWILFEGTRCPRIGHLACNEVLWILVCSGVSLLVCVLLHVSS